METDVGELQAAANRRKSQCKVGQGSGWQTKPEAKMLKTFKSAFRNSMQNQCRIFRDRQIMVEAAGISWRWCWDSRSGRGATGQDSPSPTVSTSVDRSQGDLTFKPQRGCSR